MIEDHPRDSGHDHPQTIDSEPLDQTRSGKLLREQKEKGGAAPVEADEDDQ